MLTVLLIPVSVAALAIVLGAFLWLIPHQQELENEKLNELAVRFTAGEAWATNMQISQMLTAHGLKEAHAPGVYCIKNESRGMMVVNWADDMMTDVVKQFFGTKNRDIATDSDDNTLLVKLWPAKDGDTKEGLLQLVNETVGLSASNDYDRHDDREILSKIPKRDLRNKKAKVHTQKFYWEK